MSADKPITQADLDMIARLNAERFTGPELLEVSDEVHSLPEDHRTWEGRMFLLAKRYRGQHYRAMAVDSRLAAMAALVANGTVALGVLPKAKDGSHMVADYVFEAAAVEPLLYRGGEHCFDPQFFLKRVLGLAEADGEA